MAQFVNMFTVDLSAPTYPQTLTQIVCEGDSNSMRVGAYVTDEGQPVTLGGNCVGKIKRADGSMVTLNGVIDANAAYVVLDQASCAIEGPLQIAVCWVSDINVTTLLLAYGTVVDTQSGVYVQPSTPIPDLTQLLAEIDNMRAATAAAQVATTGVLGNFAPAFSSSTAYTAGQYVTYTDGKLYRFISDHAAGVWNSSHVTVVTVGDELDETVVNARCEQSFTSAQKDTARDNIGAASTEDVEDLRGALSAYEDYAPLFKSTLSLIVGYYNNSGVLVEVESGWRTTIKFHTHTLPTLSTNPSNCQIWKDGSYVGKYDYADWGSLPAFDTIVFTWSKNNVPASGIIITPVGAVYTALAQLESDLASAQTDIDNAEDAIAANKSEYDSFISHNFDSSIVNPANLLNYDAITPNTYITESGVTGSNDAYMTSDYMPVEVGKEYELQVGAQTVHVGRQMATITFLCAFDSNKQPVSASGARNIHTYTVPSGISYIRISFANRTESQYPAVVEVTGEDDIKDWSEYFAPYTKTILKAGSNNDPHIISLIEQITSVSSGTVIFTATSASLAANTNMICCEKNDNKKNEYIEFFANLSSFGTLTIAHGKGSYGGSYIEIDSTTIKVFTYNGTQVEEFTHGLTIADFLSVVIYTKNNSDCRSSIVIMSSGGSYKADTTRYYSSRGAVLCNATFAMTNVKMQYVVNDAKEIVWVYGDSYVSMGDPNRWATQLVSDGHKNVLICGFGGAQSADEIVCFRAMTELCTPKFIVWCLGMNDGDSGAVNASWKTCVDEFIATCNEKNITPILATIPNVPSITHTYKNTYVRESGCRYVDFAKAVNAESAGATWYPGMLSQDNIHPAALGAKALMYRFILDVPETLYGEE